MKRDEYSTRKNRGKKKKNEKMDLSVKINRRDGQYGRETRKCYGFYYFGRFLSSKSEWFVFFLFFFFWFTPRYVFGVSTNSVKKKFFFFTTFKFNVLRDIKCENLSRDCHS